MEQIFQTLRPTSSQERETRQTIGNLQKILTSALPKGMTLELFGSRAYDLHLKDSDIDFRIVGHDQHSIKALGFRQVQHKLLHVIAATLYDHFHVEKLFLNTRARVPVLTFLDPKSKTQVDISAASKFPLHRARQSHSIHFKKKMACYFPPFFLFQRLAVLCKALMKRNGIYKVMKGGAGSARVYGILAHFLAQHGNLSSLDQTWDAFLQYASCAHHWNQQEGFVKLYFPHYSFTVHIHRSYDRDRKRWAQIFQRPLQTLFEVKTVEKKDIAI